MSSTSCNCCVNLEKVVVPGFIVRDITENVSPAEVKPEYAVEVPGILTVKDTWSFPIVKNMKLDIMFQEMVEILNNNLVDYKENILSFWILDMFIEGLKTAQDSGMGHEHQKITLIWIAFMFNYILKNNVSRSEAFKYLFSLILPLPHSEYLIGEYGEDEEEKIIDFNKATLGQETWSIPLPPMFDEKKLEMSLKTSADSFPSENPGEETEVLPMEKDALNVTYMMKILEILYRIFSRFWVFKALQIAFHETPVVNIVDLPFTLNTPKPIFVQEPLTSLKSGKSQKKQQDDEIDLASYKNDFILPLQLADGAETYVRQLFNLPSKETTPVIAKKSKK